MAIANEEQLSILKQGSEVWNKWREGNPGIVINLNHVDLMDADLSGADLWKVNLTEADLRTANLRQADLSGADLRRADLGRADLFGARLIGADLRDANLWEADLSEANLNKAKLIAANLNRANLTDAIVKDVNLNIARLGGAELVHANLRNADFGGADLNHANLWKANLIEANFNGAEISEADLSAAELSGAYFKGANLSRSNLHGAHLRNTKFGGAWMAETIFVNSDLSVALELEDVNHSGPSRISTDTFALSKGKIPEVFLRGCGLSDWEIEETKLYNPELNNEDINKILYRIYDLRATQAIQISPLFLSYNHADGAFVDMIGNHLTEKGIRYWRDIHEMKAGRLEKQIDRAIRQNPTVLLILSKHSLNSDWVEHEVRSARELEKEMGRDVLCPVALDDSWKSSKWPKRVMEQIMEYNILDFSAWEDDSKFDSMFRKLIDGLQLFYKG